MNLGCENVRLKKFVAAPALKNAILEKAPNDAVSESTRAVGTSFLGAAGLPGFWCNCSRLRAALSLCAMAKTS